METQLIRLIQQLKTAVDSLKTSVDKLTNALDSVGTDKFNVDVEATVADNVGIKDTTGTQINPAKEDGNLASIKTNTDNLDVLLSTRASESTLSSLNSKDFATETTLSGIKTQTDKFTFDASNYLKIAYGAGTFPVTATDLDIRNLSKTLDEVYAVIRTDAGVAIDPRDRNWTITETVTVDPEPVGLLDSTDVRINPAKEDGNLASIKTNTDYIDVPLSSIVRLRVYEQDFEDGTTDTTTNNCTQTVQSSVVYAGTYALQVTISAGQTGYIETPTRPVSANQRVTFSFAHKEDANITDVKLIVVWRRSSGGIISEDEYTLTPSTSWTVDSRTLTAPNKATSMSVRMQGTASSGADGNVYVDEITMDLVGQILKVDGSGNLMVVIENDSVPIDDAGGSITVDATDLDIRNLSKTQDEVYSVLRTDAGVAYDARDRNWTITETVTVDPEPVGLLDSTDVRINPAKEDGNLASIKTNTDNLDVLLSTRASESTLSSIDTKVATESTLSSVLTKVDNLDNALASIGTDKLRASIVDELPAGTQKIGSVDVGFPVEITSDEIESFTSTSDGTGTGAVLFSNAVKFIVVVNITDSDTIYFKHDSTNEWRTLSQGRGYVSTPVPVGTTGVMIKHDTTAQNGEVWGYR